MQNVGRITFFRIFVSESESLNYKPLNPNVMKAKDLIDTLCRQGVNMESYQVVEIVEPLDDCARLFGDFNCCILPTTGYYLAEWVNIDENSELGQPDAILILENASKEGLVQLFRID